MYSETEGQPNGKEGLVKFSAVRHGVNHSKSYYLARRRDRFHNNIPPVSKQSSLKQYAMFVRNLGRNTATPKRCRFYK
jgi:hypothetical protein